MRHIYRCSLGLQHSSPSLRSTGSLRDLPPANNDISHTTRSINLELEKIHEWLEINRLSLNVQKTNCMLFHHPQRKIKQSVPKLHIQQTEIERVHEFNFLGLTIDDNLSWHAHIQKVSNKLSKTIGILNKLKQQVPMYVLRMLYNALILPHIQYSILCWGYRGNRIIKLQKRAIRVITRSKYNAHTDPLFKTFNLLKYDDILKIKALKTYYHLVNRTLPEYVLDMFSQTDQVVPYSLRPRHELPFYFPKTSLGKNCLRYHLPHLIIKTDPSVKSKASTHSYVGFCIYARTHAVSLYFSSCIIHNCYVCNNNHATVNNI